MLTRQSWRKDPRKALEQRNAGIICAKRLQSADCKTPEACVCICSVSHLISTHSSLPSEAQWWRRACHVTSRNIFILFPTIRKPFPAPIPNPCCCNCSPDPSLCRVMKEELFFIFSTVYSACEDELCAHLVFSRLSNRSHFSFFSKLVFALLWQKDSESHYY